MLCALPLELLIVLDLECHQLLMVLPQQLLVLPQQLTVVPEGSLLRPHLGLTATVLL